MASAVQTTTLSDAEVEVLAMQMREDLAAERELLDELRAKERLLMKQKIDEIEGWITAADPLLRRIEAIAARRKKILDQLAKKLGLKGPARLGAIIARAPAGAREALEEIHKDVADTARKTLRQNQKNSLIARESMILNQEILHRIFSCPPPPTTYGLTGQEKVRTPGRILDREA